MRPTRKLWQWLGVIFVLSFAALGFIGWQIHLRAPPIPSAVVSEDGEALFGPGEVLRGQQAWLSAGGRHGLWYARSPEMIHSGLMETLVWLRVPGDVVFALGAGVLALYALRLLNREAGARPVPRGAVARA